MFWRSLAIARILLLGTCLLQAGVVAQAPQESDSGSGPPQEQLSGLPAVLDRSIPAVIALPTGSGVLVSPEGWFLTAAHVVNGSPAPLVAQLSSGERIPVRMVAVDADGDLALGQLQGTGPWPFLPTRHLRVEDQDRPVLALGYPLGMARGEPAAVRWGTLIEISAERLVSQAAIMGGDSGGALVDSAGYLVGIHSRINPESGANFHLPLTRFAPLWERTVKRPFPWGPADVEPHESAAPLDESPDAGPRLLPDLDGSEALRGKLRLAGGTQVAATPLGRGWWLAKASHLRAPVQLETAAARRPLNWISTSEELDLALLREIDFEPDAQAAWTIGGQPRQGEWVRALSLPGNSERRWGLLAVPPQRLSLEFLDDPLAAIGLTLADSESLQSVAGRSYRVRQIHGVRRGSSADAAGFRLNDWLVLGPAAAAAPGAPKPARPQPPELGQRPQIIRGGELLERRLPSPEQRHGSIFDRWGGPLSLPQRFPVPLLIHDSQVRPQDCGGPLMDARGRLVGINIARGTRVSTFAIPWPEVQAWLRHTPAAADMTSMKMLD